MPATAPSSVVMEARSRRAGRTAAGEARIEWFIEEVSGKIAMTMEQRVRVATQLLKDKVVRNISTAVVKGVGPRGGRVVTGRSKPGEFPRAETTQLMKTIMSDVQQTSPGVWDGFVGTPLRYGLILETRMDRSFLVRTLREEQGRITRILSGPIR